MVVREKEDEKSGLFKRAVILISLNLNFSDYHASPTCLSHRTSLGCQLQRCPR
jgi:hypothetical protein